LGYLDVDASLSDKRILLEHEKYPSVKLNMAFMKINEWQGELTK
jgi:hypothetical protein